VAFTRGGDFAFSRVDQVGRSQRVAAALTPQVLPGKVLQLSVKGRRQPVKRQLRRHYSRV
jgi:hypothetical protein